MPPSLEIGLQRLDELARRGGGVVEVRRIAEHVQVDADLMADLKAAGVVPGNAVEVRAIARFGDPVPVVSAEGTGQRGAPGRARGAGARALTPDPGPRATAGLCHRMADRPRRRT